MVEALASPSGYPDTAVTLSAKGRGLSHTHLTVILLHRRLLNRETRCGKKGRAGIFCLPWTPGRATWSEPVTPATCTN